MRGRQGERRTNRKTVSVWSGRWSSGRPRWGAQSFPVFFLGGGGAHCLIRHLLNCSEPQTHLKWKNISTYPQWRKYHKRSITFCLSLSSRYSHQHLNPTCVRVYKYHRVHTETSHLIDISSTGKHTHIYLHIHMCTTSLSTSPLYIHTKQISGIKASFRRCPFINFERTSRYAIRKLIHPSLQVLFCICNARPTEDTGSKSRK